MAPTRASSSWTTRMGPAGAGASAAPSWTSTFIGVPGRRLSVGAGRPARLREPRRLLDFRVRGVRELLERAGHQIGDLLPDVDGVVAHPFDLSGHDAHVDPPLQHAPAHRLPED